VPVSGNALAGPGLPFTWCWFYFEDAGSHRVEHAPQLIRPEDKDGRGNAAPGLDGRAGEAATPFKRHRKRRRGP